MTQILIIESVLDSKNRKIVKKNKIYQLTTVKLFTDSVIEKIQKEY